MIRRMAIYSAPVLASAIYSEGQLHDFLVMLFGGSVFWIPYWLACWLSNDFRDIEIGQYKPARTQLVFRSGDNETRVDI